MAPEQFRREALDEHANQFSFCVALHEALHGSRPMLAHLHGSTAAPPADADVVNAPRRAGAPAWLRNVVVRGLSEDRTDRFPSMNALLAEISRGQGRVRAERPRWRSARRCCCYRWADGGSRPVVMLVRAAG